MRNGRLVALLLALVMLSMMIVPAYAETSGGWKINTRTGNYLTAEEKKIFEDATDGLTGVAYTPVYLLAKKVVAGTEYAFLCWSVSATAKPERHWRIVFICRDLQGKSSIEKVKSFSYKNIKTRSRVYSVTSNPGGWNYNRRNVSARGIPSAAKKAFKAAMENHVGVSFTALALLGTQLVAGTNYKFFCRGVTSDAAGTACLYEVNVYQDLQGNCRMTDCKVINLPRYLTK